MVLTFKKIFCRIVSSFKLKNDYTSFFYSVTKIQNVHVASALIIPKFVFPDRISAPSSSCHTERPALHSKVTQPRLTSELSSSSKCTVSPRRMEFLSSQTNMVLTLLKSHGLHSELLTK